MRTSTPRNKAATVTVTGPAALAGGALAVTHPARTVRADDRGPGFTGPAVHADHRGPGNALY
ncbi:MULTISPECIES: hypothetical protein [unclassified Streptomyces]|uniref:hypothetical protein n=1 Tax=unclassified Streptomyces TaxID=2593676 RepID=UPI000DD82BF0|nr:MULTISPECIES: hypothetical protein [unclassified Streptomyces]QZZ30194.1 hypothetical protein A7X85_31665 [Streptomyces sp. ST1015]